MTTRTFTHLYDSYDEAARVVGALEAAGVPHADISIVGSNHDGRVPAPATTGSSNSPASEAETGAGTGAGLGTVVGGGAGLLAGIGALAIPGIGPLVAAGWLIATLTGAGAGAAAGSLLGSLTGAGVHKDDAHVYAEGVRRGGTLVTVRADEGAASRIEQVLAGSGSVDVAARRASYQSNDWSRFDDTAAGYGTAEVAAERQRTRTL
ncbi:MAG: hypothetical protein ACRYGI_04555 [Janthinobacterium lividum]